ncbi:NB-ARC domain-containing disease resistance protein [Prunus dulcis]|uniref:NB-ARC domain-containing disease resistance protein n=1 Tax=Prunus dulcis TaxID=3755 RepID=A0A4Y1REM3_PRUDU|nr:NB-ARC domain-containing disease resistance protein [Prunus dulcis]
MTDSLSALSFGSALFLFTLPWLCSDSLISESLVVQLSISRRSAPTLSSLFLSQRQLLIEMETIVILVCYNGKWVTSKKMCKYEGGDSKGLIVPRTIKFAELLDRVHQIGNTNSREDKVCLKFSVLVASNEWKHIKIEDDDDVNFFMKYNSEVTPSKLAPLLVSIEDKGLTNDVVHSMHITTDSSRMGHSSVAIVESNEVTWNNTNVTDGSEVEEMHGGDNGTERNEVSVYSAPPNLGCLNTAAQLPIMRLGGESEPTRQHYWSQMGEQNGIMQPV